MAHQWRSKFLLLLLLLIQHLVKHNIWKCLFVCLFVSRWFNSTNQSQNTLSKILCFYFIFFRVFLAFVVVYKASFCVGFSPQSVATLQKCFSFFSFFYLFYVLNKCLVQVPTSLCSPECPAGYIKKQNGIYECCFDCEICANGTYVNITGNGLYILSLSTSLDIQYVLKKTLIKKNKVLI